VRQDIGSTQYPSLEGTFTKIYPVLMDEVFFIESHSESFERFPTFYRVVRGRLGWRCDCPQNSIRRIPCKHIEEAQQRKRSGGSREDQREAMEIIRSMMMAFRAT
jgi:hypothetical protein